MTAEELAALQNDALAALRSAITFGRSGDALAFHDLCLRLGVLEPSRSQEVARIAAAEGKALQDALSAQYSAKTDAWRKALDNHDTQKQEPLACAWCRRNPSVASFSRNGTGSPICAECVWPASRGKPVLGNPPKWLDDKKCPAPEHAPGCGTAHDASLSCAEAAAAVTRHASTVAKMHPDDQKTGLNTVRDADGNPRPTPPCLFAVHGKGVCHMPHGHKEDHWFGAPALSPRQALGEALACVERALSLLNSNREPTMDSRAYDASKRLMDARSELAGAYEAAK